MDELLQEFIAETRETLEALAGEIVAWEANPGDRARLDAIFRFVHTVKGSCGFLDLPRLSRLSHAAEDVLAAVRDGKRAPSSGLVNAVLAVVDRIGELVEAIDAGVALDDSSEELLIAALAEDADVEVLAATQATPVARTPTRSVRLSVDLLDRMMSGMSDMVLARNELARRLRQGSDPSIEAALERLTATVADMRDTVTRTRMQRVETLFSALPRLVRDTAATAGKTVQLAIDGSDVELDREMIEMMRDPLVHMIRNAIDHGIEAPAQRRAAGKAEAGRLEVAARQTGNRIVIEVSDDGRGIDTDRLLAKLAAADPARDAELRALNEAARLDLIFEPGASTADAVSTLSGRGVGMDVVRANIEQIGGRIHLANRPGRGLTVTIEVPLTLAIISAVTVVVGEHRFAIPRQAIDEIIASSSTSIRIDSIGDAATVMVRDQRLPLVDLGTGIGLSPSTAATIVLVAVPGGRYALAVDRVLDTEELVVKPLAPVVMASGIYAGQTLPDSGSPMLLIDCGGVAAACGVRFDRAPEAAVADEAAAPIGEPALLFEDFDGARRAVHLAAIDRVEQVGITEVAILGGRRQVMLDGRPLPLASSAPLPATGTISVLRLNDGANEIGYAVADALDIVVLPAALAPALPGGPILGVALIEGVPVETIDTLWLFAEAAVPTPATRALCLLQGGEVGWMDTFLRPVLEAAGYRVATSLGAGEIAHIALAMDDDVLPVDGGAPVMRLSRRPGQGVYRYDRGALIAALAAQVAGRTR